MKNAVLMMMAILLGLGVIWAQSQPTNPHPSPEEHAKRISERLKADLNLSEAQTQQVYEIHLKHAKKREEMRLKGERPEVGKHHELRKVIRQEVEAVLTPEQATKAKELHQKRREIHRQLRENEDLRAEMKQYHRQNILPVIRTQRLKLEAELSDKEKQVIAQVRSQMRQHKPRKNKEEWEEMPREERQEIRKAKHEKMREILEPLRAIAEAHRETLKALHEEIATQEAEWREAKKSIVQQYLPEGESLPPHLPSMKAPHHKVIKFLLLDPNKTINNERGENLEAFPNPSKAQLTLRFELKTRTKVKLNLLDQKGNIVKEILDTEKSAGSHEVKVNTQVLAEGVYYAHLIGVGIDQKQRVVVQK